MFEPSFGDIGDGASCRFTELPFNRLRNQRGADLLGVPLCASDGAGEVTLLAGARVSAEVDVDSPGVPPANDVALHTGYRTTNPLPSPLPSGSLGRFAVRSHTSDPAFPVGATGFEPVTSAV